MKPAAPAGPRQTVTLTAADRGAEIIVIDAAFNKVAGAVGKLEIALPPGIYKARFKAGNRIADQLFEVADRPLSITGAALAFASPIPLPGTSNQREYHYAPLRQLAQQPPAAVLGRGAELFLFVRDSQRETARARDERMPWDGLCIHDDQGRSVDLESRGTFDAEAGWAAIKLQLAPGIYFIAQPESANPLLSMELVVATCQGWCTQVYLDAKDAAHTNTARIADLAGAAIVMTRVGAMLAVSDDGVRLTELARHGLMRGTGGISDEDVAMMVDGKTENPMLGLYAAHLLAARAQVRWPLILQIAENLDRWLGSGHPDVDVLLSAAALHVPGSAQRSPAQRWPPMLAASWELAYAHHYPCAEAPEMSERYGQYRLSGTLWTCLLRPRHAPTVAEALPAADEPPAVERKRATRAVRRARDALSRGAGSIRTPASRPGATAAVHRDESLMPQMPAAAASVADKAASIKSAWKGLHTALRHPNPASTPFKQALRRRVLDLLEDDAEEDLALEALARQFRLPLSAAVAALQQLRQDAEQSRDTAARTDE